MTTTHHTTFWNFLKKEKIEIPIIQRDYAQGRKGQEKLREKFLKDLKNALDNPNQKLKLDFVYGSVENEELQPLDGQQRLTTLWLLHWYIAHKAGKLTKNTDIFKRFTYETRTSSREFCAKLSEFTEAASEDIISEIQNQTWFYSAWKQDPTIQAMLNMLGGTDVTEKDADIVDGIDELFKDKFEEYWNILTDGDCPIIFYYMPLNDLKLSDDLYIKMNARGKQLTSFENFKADMVGYIKKRKEEKDADEGWKQFNINAFENKLDTDWTDIFWKNKSDKSKIDDIYFAFLNRYFLNALIIGKKNGFVSQKEITDSKVFEFLYGNESNDNSIVYSGFDIYESIANDVSVFEKLSTILTNFSSAFKQTNKMDINKLFYPTLNNTRELKFIPEYNENTISHLTTTQRVVFHAICCYFEKKTNEAISFKKWMRVVWNIVENTDISKENLVGAVCMIDELGSHSHDIYHYLKDRNSPNEFAKEQMEEEKEKARQIVLNPEWETKIIEAENTAFFKGSIRFLFRTDEKTYDWSKFDERLDLSKKYFNNDGVIILYKQNANLLRLFISKFSQWYHFYPWDSYKTQLFYDNSIRNWKNVLNHLAYVKPVNSFFDDKTADNLNFENFNSILQDPKLKSFQNDLVKSIILSKIPPECTFHFWNYGGYYSLYPYNTKTQSKIIVLANRRNEVLNKLENDKIIKVDDWQKIEGIPYYKGWEINFTLMSNGRKYQWWNCLKELTENKWIDIPNINLDNLECFFKEIKV